MSGSVAYYVDNLIILVTWAEPSLRSRLSQCRGDGKRKVTTER